MKRISLLFFALSISAIIFSQDIKFGVYFSPQFSWFSPESKAVNSDGSIVRFAGGLIVDNFFAKNYAFSTGISIAGQGGRLNYNENSNSTLTVYDSTYNLANKSVKYTAQYINIPVGLKLRSNEIGYLRFHVLIGFTNQFNIRARATDESSSNDFYDDSVKDDFNVYNLSYHFGGGVDYALGEDTSISVSIVYDNGFVDLFKADPRVNSRVISIRTGFTF